MTDTVATLNLKGERGRSWEHSLDLSSSPGGSAGGFTGQFRRVPHHFHPFYAVSFFSSVMKES